MEKLRISAGILYVNRVAQFSVGIVQMTWLWAVLGDYTFPFWVSKQRYA